MNDSILSKYNTLSFTHIIGNPYWQTLFLILGALHLRVFHMSVSKMDTNAYYLSSVELQGFKLAEKEIETKRVLSTLRLFYAEQEILGGSCWISSNQTESSETIGFRSPLCVNNGNFSVDRGINESDRMAFILWGSGDRLKSRFILGSSGTRWTQASARHSVRAIQAKSSVQLDLFPPWPWILDTVAADLIFSSAFLLMFGCGRLKHAIQAKRLLHVHVSLLAVAKVIAAAGYAACGRWREAVSPAACCVIAVAISAALAQVRQFLFFCTVLAFAALFGRAVDDCLLFDDCLRLIDEPPLAAASIAALGVACVRHCRRDRLRAACDIAADQARYDIEWRRLQLREAADLARLEAAAADAAAACPDGRARQLIRRQNTTPPRRPPQHQFSMIFDAEFLGPAAPPEPVLVTSLDQLFAQAAGVVHFLCCACESWAAASGGVVAEDLAAGTNSDADWDDVWARPMPGLKSARRAVAKAACCYRGDASRLLDICRARIVYGGAAGLRRGLEVIRAAGGDRGKGGVRVVRVKNGLRKGCDAGLTAGFRVSVRGLVLSESSLTRLGAAQGFHDRSRQTDSPILSVVVRVRTERFEGQF